MVDILFFIKDKKFSIIEVQYERSWDQFRIYIYDWQKGNYVKLNIQTPNSSISFGNPHITIIPIGKDKNRVIVTYFLFGEGTKTNSKEAGEVIFWQDVG